MAAAAAAVVVLPTPPDPQQMAISLAASSWSTVAARPSPCLSRGVIGSYPQLGRQGGGHLAEGPLPVGPGEQVGHVDQGHRVVDAVAQPLQMAGPGAAEGDGQAGGGQQGPGVAGGGLAEVLGDLRVAQGLEDLLLGPGEQL